MDIEILKDRSERFLLQLKAECGIFERIVYKNKNQHRRCSYFQYLLRVRRDLKLLQSAKLDDILVSCYHVITGNKPGQKLDLLESLKQKRHSSRRPNFMERLLGVARLLSDMTEPIIKGAVEVSVLLARSFFMGFSITVLALLARLRVLVQQILLDVVSIYNMVSLHSQKKQSVKIIEKGIEVFRDIYPENKKVINLKAVWRTDKFVLQETTTDTEADSCGNDTKDTVAESCALKYRRLLPFLGDESNSRRDDNDMEDEVSPYSKEEIKSFLSDFVEVERSHRAENEPNRTQEATVNAGSPPTGSILGSCTMEPSRRNVAFVSVKRPSPSSKDVVPSKRPAIEGARWTQDDGVIDKENSFFNLLTNGLFRDTL